MISFIDVVSVILAIITAILTYSMLKLNKTMTTIAEDDKREKTGHDLSIVLPTSMYDKETNKTTIINFCIVNCKNKTETIYRIYIKDDETENDFWIATTQPIIIPPYDCVYIPHNSFNAKKEIVNLIDAKIYAVTNDYTVSVKKDIDCYNKPLEN